MNFQSFFKVSFLSIVFFFTLCSVLAMDEDEGSSSKSLLSINRDSEEELRPEIKEKKKQKSQKSKAIIRALNLRLTSLSQIKEGDVSLETALAIYTTDQLGYEYFNDNQQPNHEADLSQRNRPFLVLQSLEEVLHEKDVPRQGVRCCCPCFLTTLEWTGRFLGLGIMTLVKSGLVNGVVGNFVDWEAGGALSYVTIGLSAFLDGPVGAIKCGDLVSRSLRKKTSSIKTRNKNEIGETLTSARLFKKSRTHQFLDFLLIPAAGMSGLMPTALWLYVERFFPGLGPGISPILLYYFGEPYYKQGKQFLGNLYADKFYIRDHQTREIRKALDASLENLQKILAREREEQNKLPPNRKAKVHALTISRLWEVLEMSQHEKKEKGQELDEKEILSVFSVFFTKVAASVEDPENPYEENWNKMLATTTIQDKPFREALAEQLSYGVMWLNLIPGIIMEKTAVATTLQVVFGAGEMASATAGYAIAGVAATRLPLEVQYHKKTFTSLFYPLDPDPADNVAERRTGRVNACAYAAFNAALYLVVYYLSVGNVSDPLFYCFAPFVALRYFSLFYGIAMDMYDEVVTNVRKRNLKKPTLEQKRTVANDLIKKLRQLVRYDLDDESAIETSKAIFKSN